MKELFICPIFSLDKSILVNRVDGLTLLDFECVGIIFSSQHLSFYPYQFIHPYKCQYLNKTGLINLILQ